MEIEEHRPLRIKQWSADDRPREKLVRNGARTLTDAELIAILIGSGSGTLNAVDVSKKILSLANNDLQELSKLTVREMTRVKGIGQVKALAIAAALELGRRRKEKAPAEKLKVSSSREAYDLLSPELSDLQHEEFWVLFLNRANKLICKKRISEGGVAGTVADPKIIFKHALDELASGIVAAHNHPSGNTVASQSDIDLTHRLKEAGKLLEIQLLDHLIIAGQKYYSFADEGVI